MLLSRFLKDRKGNIVPIFAAALVPVVGLVGAAVDYSRASAIRSEMQAGLDATALMLSKEAAGLSSGQLQDKATAYFQAVFNRPEAKSVIITPTYSNANGASTIRVVSTGSVDTTFTRILGQSKIDLGSSSEVTWGFKKLELALALDNTGSMLESNKMDELKKAAKNLLSTLQKAVSTDGDVKVAIIPFTTAVNVGTDKVSANWISWDDWDAKNGQYCKKNGQCSDSDQGNAVWTPNGHSTWNGCVIDRDKDVNGITTDYDVNDTTPDAGLKKALFPANQSAPCPVSLLPLTSGWGALNNKIDSMVADGYTNVTIGLAWAWHALTTSSPLTEGAAPSPERDKVIVLLTDGENTQNRWSSGWFASWEIDPRTKKACDNIKAANIKLYTVRVIEGNAALLQGCASKPEMYFDVQSASQLNTVFQKIGDNLASLRISK